jgi:hypothetical protein
VREVHMSGQHPNRRYKGCTLCKPENWRGQGPARKLPMRDLRRLGVKRRLGARWVNDREADA